MAVEGQEVSALDAVALRRARRGIGMIFQHFNLLSSRTVAGNVALPLEGAGLGRREIATRVPELLDLVGRVDHRDAYPAQISGGQKQRVGIARALALRPSVLLCDEATSALDPETTSSVLALLREINRSLGLTVLLITHEMQVVREIADRVAVLEHGVLVEEGSTYDLLAAPQSDVARSFLAEVLGQDLPVPVAATLLEGARPGSEPVLRIVFSGETAFQPVIADLATRFALRPNILHGRVEYVQGRPLGVLTLALGGGAVVMPAVLAHLASLNLQARVIGHVLGHRAAAA